MPDHRPALSDIAAALGVSTMTVSRALGGRPGVSPALRARIQQQAIALGYRPDPSIHRLMRHLRTRRQRGISAVIAAITDIPQHLEPTYCARLREHAALRAHALGFAFSLVRVSPGPGGWPSALRALRSQGVDGLMLLPMIDPIALDAVDWSAFSVVSATSSVTTPLFHRVGPHHPLNARLLVDRLSARGFHRIGFVGTHTHSLRSFDSFPSALAWHHARLGLRCMPLLHPAGTAPDIVAWARRERPDVIIAGRHTDLPA
jgi:DNA-binding LacI/PurR family transcriptional regulator